MEIIQCPNCKDVALSDDTFSWMPDNEGHPTEEKLLCLSCLASNIEIEFEDGTTNEVFEVDEFIMVDEEDLSKSDMDRLLIRTKELEEYWSREIVTNCNLPF